MADLTDREKLILSTWGKIDEWPVVMEQNGIDPSKAIAKRIIDEKLSEGKTEEEFMEWCRNNVVNQGPEVPIGYKTIEEYEALEWRHQREKEYPYWGHQLEKIYDDGVDKWKEEMIDPIKVKWPKDNSGPVE